MTWLRSWWIKRVVAKGPLDRGGWAGRCLPIRRLVNSCDQGRVIHLVICQRNMLSSKIKNHVGYTQMSCLLLPLLVIFEGKACKIWIGLILRNSVQTRLFFLFFCFSQFFFYFFPFLFFLFFIVWPCKSVIDFQKRELSTHLSSRVKGPKISRENRFCYTNKIIC